MELNWSEGTRGEGLVGQWGELCARGGESGGRALTMNLIARAHDAGDAQRMAECLWKLGRQHPARVFLLVPGDNGGTARLRVAAHPQGSEMVEAEMAPERAVSWVGPLLAADLPTLLWWHGGRPNDSPEFAGWSRLADRVLVDAHRMRLSAAHLAELGRAMHPPAQVTDLAWTRLTPWRQLLCQGLEATPGGAHRIGRVTLTTGGPASANLAAILLAGWMAEMLHWTPQERLGPHTVGLRRRLPTSPVVLQFEPEAARATGLRRLLVAGDDDGMAVEIELKDGRGRGGAHLAMTVRNGGAVVGEWAGAGGPSEAQSEAGMETPLRGETETLCEELSLHGADGLYQPSLERGLALLAELETPYQVPAA